MLRLALAAGKAAGLASRALRRGSGTTFPGVVAEKLDPRLVSRLAESLPAGSVVVTGTNGKTTTTKMLGDIHDSCGTSTLRNDSGSNLRQGIASALVSGADVWSARSPHDIGIFEVDEAATRLVVPQLQPRVLCVTNISRDQLARHGDLDALRAKIEDAVMSAPASTLLLNADDPLVTAFGARHAGPVVYYGIQTADLRDREPAAGSRAISCPRCGGSLRLGAAAYGHLGEWECRVCGASRPALHIAVSEIALDGARSAFTLDANGESVRITLPVGGLHNVYNALAAASCAVLSGVPLSRVAGALARFEPPFGRSEQLPVDGGSVELVLAKNPLGAEQALACALAGDEPKALGFALNDNVADGTDVSWIWDIAFEAYDLTDTTLVLSGTRAEDLALRLKYAGLKAAARVVKDPAEAIRVLKRSTPPGGSAHMLATYTAMLAIRGRLVGGARRFSTLGRELRCAP